MALEHRRIKLTFQLGTGTFSDGNSDTYSVEGLRCSAAIEKSGAIMAALSLRVFGMSLEVMNRLSLFGTRLTDGANNFITVEAGTDDAGLAVVYKGVIQEAWIDARNMPQVAFIVTAATGLTDALKPVPPTSYKGTIEVALAMAGLAEQAGLQLENNGVEGVISDPYLHGCLRRQIQDLAQAAPCNFYVDGFTADDPGDGTKGGVLAIWPIDGTRGGLVPLIAPDTGMVGYPLRTEYGFTVQTLFSPSTIFGGQIRVESAIPQANGYWDVISLTHEIEAETPNGKWFTTIQCRALFRVGQ